MNEPNRPSKAPLLASPQRTVTPQSRGGDGDGWCGPDSDRTRPDRAATGPTSGGGADGALDADEAAEVEAAALAGDVLARGDAEDAHALVVAQAGEQLGRDEEVLARVLAAGDLDHALVHHALVARVHALVDLVDDAERRLRHRLQRHQVEDRRHRPLPARLPVLVQLLERLVLAVCGAVRSLSVAMLLSTCICVYV